MSFEIQELEELVRSYWGRYHGIDCASKKDLDQASDIHLEMVESGCIWFYRVGHNASHEFYLGCLNDKLYRGAICEDTPFYFKEVPVADPGYLGHY